MKDLREMYKELYAVINSMPLPTSPDDPESPEPEEYVEPEWVAQLDSCGRDEDKDLHLDACSLFEIAYEKAHEWDTLYPDYRPAPEPVVYLDEEES